MARFTRESKLFPYTVVALRRQLNGSYDVPSYLTGLDLLNGNYTNLEDPVVRGIGEFATRDYLKII